MFSGDPHGGFQQCRWIAIEAFQTVLARFHGFLQEVDSL
jgi:hypothetical protein